MLLPFLSNVYKILARGTALYFCNQCYPCSTGLLLQCVFFPSKTRNSSSGAVNAPASAAVPTASSCGPTASVSRTLLSQVLLVWGTPFSTPNHSTYRIDVLSYKLHVLHYSVTGNLSPKLKLLIGEYIITCRSLSKQKACGKTPACFLITPPAWYSFG